MIGQKSLKDQLHQQINRDYNIFPRFSIVVGERGSGKKSLVAYIAGLMRANFIYLEDNSVASVRQMIDEVYRLSDITVYRIADADTMSNEAKNALLKVTEEPPNNAYFIMTLEDENNTLDTIRSRASIIRMEPYTPDEIEEYVRYVYESPGNPLIMDEHFSLLITLCGVPGDVELLLRYNAVEFYTYVKKVHDNISDVSVANAFKIAEKIALKNEEDKYDLKLFWKAYLQICWEKWNASGMRVTCEYLQKLKSKSINKQMLFDRWLVDIRGE